MMIRKLAVAALLLAPLSLHAALDPKSAAAQYEQSQKWQFATTAIPVPASGLTITRDTATWTLQSGSVRLMQPLADGTITGFVFEGSGRFRMTVPDRFEVAQLRRFAQQPLDEINQAFTQLVFRTSDDTINKLFPNASSTGYASYGLADKRLEASLTQHFADTDARVIAAQLNPNALAIIADFKTENLDWLTYDYDWMRAEEIQLARNYSSDSEIWISLDRPQDRAKDGRPGDPQATPVSIEHFDVKADLTKFGRIGEVGRSNQRTINGHYLFDVTVVPKVDGGNAIVLDLPSRAK
ncbi:MAG TPA: hypothetical protein VMU84_06785, partial [Thermoanaerobaculia bacterium]|nr:hypothetical protein [Thermoanaerobaculia bacterium]